LTNAIYGASNILLEGVEEERIDAGEAGVLLPLDQIRDTSSSGS
jgi:hypothetical protein